MPTTKTQIEAILKDQFRNPEVVEFCTNDFKPRLDDQGEWSGDYTSLAKLDLNGFNGTGNLHAYGETAQEQYFLDIKFKNGELIGFEVEVQDV